MFPSVTRRQFVGAAAAAAAGAAFFDLPGIRTLSAAEPDFQGLPVGIQSYTLRNFKLDDCLRHVQGLGLHYIEFFSAHVDQKIDGDELAALKQKLKAAKITCYAHGVNEFTKDHEANRKWFEFAKRVGFKNITANPRPDSFDSLDKLCEEYQIRICIHNHGPGALYDKLDSVTKAVKDHHPLVGACVDTGHVLRSDEDPVKWVKELGPRVFALHIKDVKEKKSDTPNVVIGRGHLDVVGTFQALKEIKFPADGAISLEYEDKPQNPIDDVQQCLMVAAEAIKKVYGQ